jgi:hypothetical protein
LDIVPEARGHLLDQDDSMPVLLLPIQDRVYEFQGEDEAITQLWHEAIMSHF